MLKKFGYSILERLLIVLGVLVGLVIICMTILFLGIAHMWKTVK